eukprot:TRINITY_DN2733_c1_g1_i5.p1 TRINITY_DN2733_c1_g1~~TRINITY_DN2733_c1_g1_i5.p1  ORF type:complete len:355 (+),score=54.39 TRINITY_DN2733_c1_g1_i5:54-1067(+)
MKLSAAIILIALLAVQASATQDLEDRSQEAITEKTSGSQPKGMMLGGVWDWDKCVNTQCKLGEGDCDTDSECVDGLVCGHNNCKTMHPAEADLYMPLADCCEVIQPLHLDYCVKNPGCGFGVGDCDDDTHCDAGLVCGHNNCRAMNPSTDPVLIHHKADCCVTCAAVTAVVEDVAHPQPPMFFVDGKVQTVERTVSKPPSVLATANVHSLPFLAYGDKIKLECCSKKNTPCNFFVAVYHCPPCSRHQNGGLPAFLAADRWVGTSCAPVFTPTGSSQAQSMTVFQKTLAPGDMRTIPISSDAPHVAVFSTTGDIGDWCPRNTASGLSGPHRPCVCLEV